MHKFSDGSYHIHEASDLILLNIFINLDVPSVKLSYLQMISHERVNELCEHMYHDDSIVAALFSEGIYFVDASYINH